MFHIPGTPEYDRASSPDNAAVPQHPALVATPRSAEQVAEAVTEAGRRGLVVVAQATGHGAGAEVGDDALLLDTSGLDGVRVRSGADADGPSAHLGAGATWGAVNAVAERSGLLGLAGSSPGVAVCGYTFGGGIGWLSRRHGLASGALRSVRWVDGHGTLRTAADDAPDVLDREAIRAFRGGGGVGIATELRVDLAPVPDLHCGYLLWPATAVDDVVGAWAAALAGAGSGVATSIAVLHLPPDGPFPDDLRGRVAVHLAVADPDGPDGAAELLAGVRRAATPALDTWGPGDAAALGRIHLDPPGQVAARGDARWLDDTAPALAPGLLATAADDDSPVVMLELRHVAGPPARRPGVLVEPVGPFVYHAVGALGRAEPAAIDDAFARARAVWAPADAGLSPASWMEGASAVRDGLDHATTDHLRALADRADPEHRIRRPRVLTG